jgi:hypothetical protein
VKECRKGGNVWYEQGILVEVPANMQVKKRYHTEVRKYNAKFIAQLEEAKQIAPVLEFCT